MDNNFGCLSFISPCSDSWTFVCLFPQCDNEVSRECLRSLHLFTAPDPVKLNQCASLS